jgi:hypothetical protein
MHIELLNDNIKTYVRQIGLSNMDWIDVAQDRDQWMALVNTVLNLRVPFMKFLRSFTTGGFS